MVLHGGSQGELTLYGMPTEYVYEWTQEELQSERIDIGGGERIPTLRDVIELYDGVEDTLLNIELKGPESPDFKPRYDFTKAAQVVYDLILEYGIAHKVMISSFQPEIISAIKEVSMGNRQFMVHRLTDDKQGDNPETYKVHQHTEGVNLYIPFLSKSLAEGIQTKGGFVGVWWSAKRQTEDEEMYDTVMKEAGVDLFYSDKPLEAMRYRDELLASQKISDTTSDGKPASLSSSSDQDEQALAEADGPADSQ